MSSVPSSSPGVTNDEPIPRDTSKTHYAKLNSIDGLYSRGRTPILFLFDGLEGNADAVADKAMKAMNLAIRKAYPEFGGWIDHETSRLACNPDDPRQTARRVVLPGKPDPTNWWKAAIEEPFRTAFGGPSLTPVAKPLTEDVFPLLSSAFATYEADPSCLMIGIMYCHVLGDVAVVRALMKAWTALFKNSETEFVVRFSDRIALEKLKLSTQPNETRPQLDAAEASRSVEPRCRFRPCRLENMQLDAIEKDRLSKVSTPVPWRIVFREKDFEEMRAIVSPEVKASRNDLMSAVLWKFAASSVMRPGYPLNEAFTLATLFSLRGRFPEMPTEISDTNPTPFYFANAAFCACLTSTRGEVRSWSLEEAVKVCQRVARTARSDPDAPVRWIRTLTENYPSEEEYESSFFERMTSYDVETTLADTLQLTNWSRAEFETLDLGKGPACDVATVCGGHYPSFARVLAHPIRKSELIAHWTTISSAHETWTKWYAEGGIGNVVRMLELER